MATRIGALKLPQMVKSSMRSEAPNVFPLNGRNGVRPLSLSPLVVAPGHRAQHLPYCLWP